MDFAKIMLASFFLIAIPSGAFAREPVLQEFYAVPASPKALPIPISMGEFWSSFNVPACEQVAYRPTWWLPHIVEARRAIYYPVMVQVACEFGLPARLLDAVIAQESGYDPRAISPVGAMGMMQVMPGTARSLGLAFPWDPIANMRAGARYLRDQANRFGRMDLALAAYNAGPERRSLKAGYIPAIPQTMGYVRTITTNWARLVADATIDIDAAARAEAAHLAINAAGYREVDLSVYEVMNASNPI